MKDITEVDHRHAKRVFRNLSNKNLDDYHDLYVQSDTLLLADVFENFRNMCTKVYELDSSHFLSAPGFSSHFLSAPALLIFYLHLDSSHFLSAPAHGKLV